MTFFLSAAKIYKNGVVTDNMECVIENYLSILLGGTNMKKILFGLLVVALLLCVTACSEDQYAKLGELMGKMSGNVYGIKPNMQDVDAATDKVDDSVQKKGEMYIVDIKPEAAQSIVESVVAVKDSISKTEALKESLDQPLLDTSATAEQKEAVQKGIQAQATASKLDPEKEGYNEKQKELAKLVNSALDAASSGVSENPTKAELATVAVLKTLAAAVDSGKGYAEAGKNAVDALKLTTEAGRVDVFANADISEIISKITGKGVSRDGVEDLKQWLPVFSKSAADVVRCITANKLFTEERYNKFILECKAIRASYEMIAKEYNISLDDKLAGQTAGNDGLTVEDFGQYIIACAFSLMDDLSRKGAPNLNSLVEDPLAELLKVYINGWGEGELKVKGNYDALVDLENKSGDLAPVTEGVFKQYTDLAVASIACVIDPSFTPEGYTLDKFVEALKVAVRHEGRLEDESVTMLGTLGVILIEGDWVNLLDMIKLSDQYKIFEGTLKSLLYVF